jgi:hypothetical protein
MSSDWEGGVEGNFPVHRAVIEGKNALHKRSIS